MTRTLLLSLASLIGGSLAVQGQTIFSQASDDMYVINNGSFTQATGAFTRTPADPGVIDVGQGVALSFGQFNLGTIGHAVQAQFTLSGITANNSAFQLGLGFFSGAAVTQNADTSVTDAWTGYFHAIATRDSNGGVNSAVYRQGVGNQPLMDRVVGWGGSSSVDGAGGTVTGNRPALNWRANQTVSMTLERVSDTQVRLTTVYVTARQDGTDSGTAGGVAWNQSADASVATLVSTYTLANGGPTGISGFALGTNTSNFTIEDLTITAIPEPRVYAALIGLLALGFVAWRRRR